MKKSREELEEELRKATAKRKEEAELAKLKADISKEKGEYRQAKYSGLFKLARGLKDGAGFLGEKMLGALDAATKPVDNKDKKKKEEKKGFVDTITSKDYEEDVNKMVGV